MPNYGCGQPVRKGPRPIAVQVGAVVYGDKLLCYTGHFRSIHTHGKPIVNRAGCLFMYARDERDEAWKMTSLRLPPRRNYYGVQSLNIGMAVINDIFVAPSVGTFALVR